MTDDQLLAMPKITNAQLYDQTIFLEQLAEMAITSGDCPLFEHCCARLAQVVLDNGRFQYTSMALACFAWVLTNLDYIAEGYRIAKLAIAIASRYEYELHDCRVMVALHFHVTVWRAPCHDGLEPMSDALRRLWNAGHVQIVMMDTSHYMFVYFCAGLRLQPLVEDLLIYLDLLQSLE